MNSFEEIALKVAKDAFAEIYGPSTTDPDPAMVKWISENARRLVAALGAQQKPIAILQLPDPEDDRDGPWFSLDGYLQLRALPAGTKLFAAPVLPSVKEGWQPIETMPTGADQSFLVSNVKGQVAPHIRGVIHCNTGTAWDWNYGEGVTHWMPLPAAPSPQEDKP